MTSSENVIPYGVYGKKGGLKTAKKWADAKKQYDISPILCAKEGCGSKIPWHKRLYQKYCSKSCSVKVNNIGRRRHGKEPDNCKSCNKKLTASKKKYCSSKCNKLFQYSDYIRKWLAGTVTGMKNGGDISRYVKRYLKEQAGNKCTKCGWNTVNPKSGLVPLHINHIDGDFLNTVPSNVEVLCPNCHSLTPNYGSLNERGKGRRSRGYMK